MERVRWVGARGRPEVHRPQPGATVRLLPRQDGPERSGALIAWSLGPGGLVATAEVALAPADVDALAGVLVWASVVGSSSGLVVVEGVTTPRPGGGGVAVTGVLGPDAEPRRAALRHAVALPVAVDAARAVTVDLSRTGARISLPSAVLPPSVRVALDLALGEGEVVTAAAEVVRVDVERGEIAVRFTGLDGTDAVRIDRAVLAALAAQL